MEKEELVLNLYTIECEIENLKKLGVLEDIKALEKTKKKIEEKLKKINIED